MYDQVLRCPACAAPSLQIGSVATVDAVIRCDNCNFKRDRSPVTGFFDLRLSPPQQERSLLAHELPLPGTAKFRSRVYSANRAMMRQVVRDLRPTTTMDVGCGPGGWGTELRDVCGAYYGLEPSDIPLERTHTSARTTQTLIQYDLDRPVPVQDASVDLLSFIASYDHIPDPGSVLPEFWAKVRPGGHLLINMTNYGTWAKTLINALTHGQRFKHAEGHFRVHSPTTLISEVSSILPDSTAVRVEADYWLAPNIPGPVGRLYVMPGVIRASNAGLKLLINRGLHMRNAGTIMIVAFQKATN
jgi:SAM-dependent methyltransferase